jgi:hypothetical protein
MQYVGDINDLGQIAASISMRLAATASSIAGVSTPTTMRRSASMRLLATTHGQ